MGEEMGENCVKFVHFFENEVVFLRKNHGRGITRSREEPLGSSGWDDDEVIMIISIDSTEMAKITVAWNELKHQPIPGLLSSQPFRV